MSGDKKVTSRDRAALFLKAAFDALHDAGGSLPLRTVKAEVAKRVSLTQHDRETYQKTGYVRWESVIHFYSIDCVKAGYLQKQDGLWHLTPEGEAARLTPAREMLDQASRAYRAWKASELIKPSVDSNAISTATDDVPDVPQPSFVLEQAQDQARNEIQQHVRALGPYDFQHLVAALLRAMRYATPFIASPGPDGGTDILAYPDPLGAQTPHIRVQVKHRQSEKASREEIAALRGVIRGDREVGLFVSSGGFSQGAIREAGSGNVHIELMDLEKFLQHWIVYYDKLIESDKSMLRLRPVYFLSQS